MPSKAWRCPECNAKAHAHGKGECRSAPGGLGCDGFICECFFDTNDKTHGTPDDPCTSAVCTHCGWEGTFPIPLFNPKKLTGWAKTAYAAGWRPPVGWTPTKTKTKRK